MMAKMFYTIEEVCAKLGKTEDEVREMASSGQLQEFRDRDKLMFKVEQIDLLAGPDEDTGDVSLELEDTSGGLSGLELKDDSVLGLTDSREGTGISVFDTDHSGDAPAVPAQEDTQAGMAALGSDEEDLSLEAVGSGSGLLDLTRESDETSLGAELLEEVYSSDDNVEIPANASGLFEAAGGGDSGIQESIGAAGAPAAAGTMPMVLETYDGSGSGLTGGLMLGALIALICIAVVVIVAINGATPGLATMFAGNLFVFAGGLLGVTIILGLVGLFIGKASE
jgi:hypothetical protein